MEFHKLQKGMTGERVLLGDGLFPGENEALYYLVLYTKPNVVCEVGTRKGGGSTYMIASALEKNRCGKLYTIEIDSDFYKESQKLYDNRLKHLKPYVNFYLGKASEVIPSVVKDFGQIDIAFLDGMNAEQVLVEYTLYAPRLKTGSYLVCHDWYIGKMRKIRPIIENDPSWKNLVDISHTQTGFAVFRKQ